MSCVTKGVSVRWIFVVNAEATTCTRRTRVPREGGVFQGEPTTRADRPARADRPG